MKCIYKWYEINVYREKCMWWWWLLYTVITRIKDDWVVKDTFEDSWEKIKDMIKYMKELIDEEISSWEKWWDEDEESEDINQLISNEDGYTDDIEAYCDRCWKELIFPETFHTLSDWIVCNNCIR